MLPCFINTIISRFGAFNHLRTRCRRADPALRSATMFAARIHLRSLFAHRVLGLQRIPYIRYTSYVQLPETTTSNPGPRMQYGVERAVCGTSNVTWGVWGVTV